MLMLPVTNTNTHTLKRIPTHIRTQTHTGAHTHTPSHPTPHAHRNTDKPATANSTEPLFWHPARPGPATFASNPTLLVEDGNDMRVELPGPGLAYSAFPTWPFDGRSADGNASFEEAAVNSAGVAISGTETISSNNASLAADPLNTDTGVRVAWWWGGWGAGVHGAGRAVRHGASAC